MATIIYILKFIAIIAAAIFIGRWFLAEQRKAGKQKKTWYQGYLSVPGILVIVILLLPFIVWWFQR